MNETGFIDFTDVHVTRIRNVIYRYEVLGASLEELGVAAMKRAAVLFRDTPFRIDGMEVEDGYALDNGDVIQYRASVVAVAE